MKRMSSLIAAIAVLGLSTAAFAGDGHCTASTQACLDKMAAENSEAGWAGLDGDWSDDHGLFTITSVAAKSPAAKAGLMEGDVVFGMNDQKFAKMTEADWKASKKARVPGATANYMIKRDGKKQEVAVVLVEMPEDVAATQLGKHMMEHAKVASRHSRN